MTRWCRCIEPNGQSGDTESIVTKQGVLECVICSACKRPIEGSDDRVAREAIEPIVEYEFAELPPLYPEPVNYWENGSFDAQTLWLLQKRDQCVRDLHALRQLLDDLRTHPPELQTQRENSFASALRQASGAFGEIEHIESLIGLIHPTFDFSALPSVRFERRKVGDLPRRGYYTEVRSVH